jgi:hypothetical protein
MTLCQNKALVDGHQAKNGPKIDENYDELFELLNRFLLQVALRLNGSTLFHHVSDSFVARSQGVAKR